MDAKDMCYMLTGIDAILLDGTEDYGLLEQIAEQKNMVLVDHPVLEMEKSYDEIIQDLINPKSSKKKDDIIFSEGLTWWLMTKELAAKVEACRKIEPFIIKRADK